jgi:type II secretory pathway pseudopilin PulG
MAAVLAALLMLALATQSVMTYVSQQDLREREADLLRTGQAYAQAIGAYYESSPGNLKRWPRTLEDLAEDKRFVGIRRHIREMYPDPITRSANWGLVMSSDGGITGVHSLSMAQPIRSAAMELDTLSLPAASRYADWEFVYRPSLPQTAPTTQTAPTVPTAPPTPRR